jgi:hypothetical protein
VKELLEGGLAPCWIKRRGLQPPGAGQRARVFFAQGCRRPAQLRAFSRRCGAAERGCATASRCWCMARSASTRRAGSISSSCAPSSTTAPAELQLELEAQAAPRGRGPVRRRAQTAHPAAAAHGRFHHVADRRGGAGFHPHPHAPRLDGAGSSCCRPRCRARAPRPSWPPCCAGRGIEAFSTSSSSGAAAAASRTCGPSTRSRWCAPWRSAACRSSRPSATRSISTLCDFAADVRAETPSARGRVDLQPLPCRDRAPAAGRRGHGGCAREPPWPAPPRKLDHARSRLRLLAPTAVIESNHLRLDDLGNRLGAALRASIQLRRGALGTAHTRLTAVSPEKRVQQESHRLLALWKRLESASPQSVLRRGYAIVRDEAGQPVARAKGTRPGQSLVNEFHDGKVHVRVE